MPHGKRTGNWFSRKRTVIAALIAATLLTVCLWFAYRTSSKVNTAQISDASRTSISEFFHQFADNGLLPIVRPGSQQVGAVYNATNGRWIYETSTCFPTLAQPSKNPSQLPSIEFSGSLDASVALGLGKALGARFDARSIHSAKLSFTEVSVEEVPEHALRSSFSPVACPDLRPIIESVSSGVAPAVAADPLLVIASLYRAKRTLSVSFDNKSAAEETINALSKLYSITGNAKAENTGKFSILLENTDPLPVAVAIAFVPTPIGKSLGGGLTNQTERVWMPFNPSVNAYSIQSLHDVINSVDPAKALLR